MKTMLVFMDNEDNSKRGTLRGLVIFPIYLFMSVCWYVLVRHYFDIDDVGVLKGVLSLLLSGLLIVSALGVNNAESMGVAAVYGVLVGFVVYGVSGCMLLTMTSRWGYGVFGVNLVWGILSTTLLSCILYKVVERWPGVYRVV